MVMVIFALHLSLTILSNRPQVLAWALAMAKAVTMPKRPIFITLLFPEVLGHLFREHNPDPSLFFIIIFTFLSNCC
jgi:hypothetical protein